MFKVVNVAGTAGGECFLIVFENSAVLFDTGFACSAAKTLENIKENIDGKKLEYILLSHSHYDHVAGTPVIKSYYPNAKVVSNAYASKIFAHGNAKKLMQELDNSAADLKGFAITDIDFDNLKVDYVAKDADRLPFTDDNIIVMQATGHTKCSVNYYFENSGLLLASETLGVPLVYPQVSSSFIVSYKDTINAIAAAGRLKPKYILTAHYGALQDRDAATFFDNAKTAADKTAEFIINCYKKTNNIEQTAQKYKEEFYSFLQAKMQPEEAFMLNTRAMVSKLLREFGLH